MAAGSTCTWRPSFWAPAIHFWAAVVHGIAQSLLSASADSVQQEAPPPPIATIERVLYLGWPSSCEVLADSSAPISASAAQPVHGSAAPQGQEPTAAYTLSKFGVPAYTCSGYWPAGTDLALQILAAVAVQSLCCFPFGQVAGPIVQLNTAAAAVNDRHAVPTGWVSKNSVSLQALVL